LPGRIFVKRVVFERRQRNRGGPKDVDRTGHLLPDDPKIWKISRGHERVRKSEGNLLDVRVEITRRERGRAGGHAVEIAIPDPLDRVAHGNRHLIG
jgi:hypothetical protein